MDLFSDILKQVDIFPGKTDNIRIVGNDPILPSPFLIGEPGAAALAAVGYIASELWHLKTNRHQEITVNVRDAAIAQRSHSFVKIINREMPALWSPISGFYQTLDDRWIQLHCNFPHHRQGVVSLLECEDTKEGVTQAIKHYSAESLETQLAERDLCASMIRTPNEWAQHSHCIASCSLPLLEVIKIGDSQREPLPAGDRPLSQINVLDLSRVIAGPMCGKTLAEQGATVMRIDSPHLPSIFPLVVDTGFGKLSAHCDLNTKSDRDTLKEMVKQSDIFSQAYRPGGLAERGFSPTDLATIRPGIICISPSAYSHKGPWATRHGYDSLVQSATGIAYEQSQSDQHVYATTDDVLAVASLLERLDIGEGHAIVRWNSQVQVREQLLVQCIQFAYQCMGGFWVSKTSSKLINDRLFEFLL